MQGFGLRIARLRVREPNRTCDHSGLHSPLGRYDPEHAVIRYVTVCDACGAETGEVGREPYKPQFKPYLHERP